MIVADGRSRSRSRRGLARRFDPLRPNPHGRNEFAERLHGRIDVEISSDDKHVMIDIKDTGKGIPKSNWKRIFEPGFTTKTRGWGLGLSLSRRVIEEYHQGRIGVVYSELGKGTDIRITLKRYFD